MAEYNNVYGDYHRKLLLLSLKRRGLNEEETEPVKEESGLHFSTRSRGFGPFNINNLVDRDTTNRALDKNLFQSLEMGKASPKEEVRAAKAPSLTSEACSNVENEATSCKSMESNRNAIMRYCAADVTEKCCNFLQSKLEASDWLSFRHCSCTRRLICDLEPFLNLESTYEDCDIPLYDLPDC